MPRYERILPLVGVTAIGLGLILLVEQIHVLTFTIPLPREFTASVSIAWLILFLLLIVVAVGAESVQRERYDREVLPAGRPRRLHVAAWILPVMVTLTAFLFLRLLPRFTMRAVGLGVATLFLFLVLWLPHYTVDPRPQVRARSLLLEENLLYLVAFFLYGSIYTLRVRSLFSATTLVFLSFLLAFSVLYRLAPRGQAALYACVVGLCVGEVTWPLNYWAITGLSGGVLLLVVFYNLLNLVRHHLQGTLTWRVAREYIVVGLLGLLLIGLDTFVPDWRQALAFWPR